MKSQQLPAGSVDEWYRFGQIGIDIFEDMLDHTVHVARCQPHNYYYF